MRVVGSENEQVTVGDVRRVLEEAYPPHLAEPWDRVGLICGDPAAPARHVAFALDCTLAVAREAADRGADMLVVHHPLLLRGVTSVAADTPKGEVVHTLLRAGVALFAAHTNADKARPGVSDRLAELIGVPPGRPIVPEDAPTLDKWGVNVPVGAAESVKLALFAAGAGATGNYAQCAFELTGTSQFCPQPGARPAQGEEGSTYRGEEVRVEVVAPRSARERVLAALMRTHPYEAPAFDIVESAAPVALEDACGLGRVGELPEATTLREFTQQVADALPETVWGVRAAGDPDAQVKTVAVSSGAGDSLLAAAAELGVDVFVTSDLRHHPVDEHLRAGGPAVIDTAHWASEFPWTGQASDIVGKEIGVRTSIIDMRTDPWTISAHPKEK